MLRQDRALVLNTTHFGIAELNAELLTWFFCKLQVNEALLAENDRLRNELEDATYKLSLLQNQVNAMRQNTVTFILEQMDTLKMQKVTQV